MINKIFNWTAGSFFRTLGRFIFYGIIVFLLYLLFFISDVSAATMSAGSNNVSINNNYNFPVTLSVSTAGNRYPLSAAINSSYGNDYNFAVLYICSNVGLDISVYNSGYNYYFNDESYFTSTGKFCTTQGYAGTQYALFLSVGKWNVGSGNTSLWYAESYLNFRSTWGYKGYVTVQSFIWSDEDLSLDLSKFNSITNSINSATDSINSAIDGMTSAITGAQQETNDKLDQTNEELGEMNDYIQDDTPASTEDVDLDSLGTVSGLLPAGPLDSLLNIPFTFLSVLTSSMSGTCVPITGTFVFDSTLSIPCFDSFYDDVPDYLMNFINLIPSGFILIMYFKHLYKKIERAVSLETTVDDEWGVI